MLLTKYDALTTLQIASRFQQQSDWLFDDDGHSCVIRTFNFGQFDVQKAIVKRGADSLAVHRPRNHDAPFKETIINFHLAKGAAVLFLPAGVFSIATNQKQAFLQRDFQILALDASQLYLDDQMLSRLVYVGVRRPSVMAGRVRQAQIRKVLYYRISQMFRHWYPKLKTSVKYTGFA